MSRNYVYQAWNYVYLRHKSCQINIFFAALEWAYKTDI